MAEGLKLCNQLWEKLKVEEPQLDHPLAYATLLTLVNLLDTDPGYWQALREYVEDDAPRLTLDGGDNG